MTREAMIAALPYRMNDKWVSEASKRDSLAIQTC
eukprot:CAMPEP_0180815156 /NCGR_PEP_ID=MMETSP1038_2-20121128/67465_1 /TAXON_ID=632150 /ORGANISM="Azadinium spinosum, Strain 3D9" /LENGTH=33 /DNA_ID= /DNA_START= /DNA_END= /DNA_ORIENTATION=